MSRRPPPSPPFPRPPLCRSALPDRAGTNDPGTDVGTAATPWFARSPPLSRPSAVVDRKSTRLNSSHANIPYAVFCLKKKDHTPELQARHYLVCLHMIHSKIS